jgi:hypothetical protein
MRNESRGDRNAEWIERYCFEGDGRPVKLTANERQQLRELYAGHLAEFVAELHRDGPESRRAA